MHTARSHTNTNAYVQWPAYHIAFTYHQQRKGQYFIIFRQRKPYFTMLRFYRIQKAVFVAERGRYVSGASKFFFDPVLVFGLLPFAFTEFFQINDIFIMLIKIRVKWYIMFLCSAILMYWYGFLFEGPCICKMKILKTKIRTRSNILGYYFSHLLFFCK